MKKPENAFSGERFYLSNFYPRGLWLNKKWYRTREHAYQAKKFADPQLHELIRLTPNARTAKYQARQHQAEVRANWHDLSLDVMEDVVYQFFKQWPDVSMKLIDTGDEHLEEKNYWYDTFWGTCNGVGENHLGKILMKVRTRLGDELDKSHEDRSDICGEDGAS